MSDLALLCAILAVLWTVEMREADVSDPGLLFGILLNLAIVCAIGVAIGVAGHYALTKVFGTADAPSDT